MMSEAATTNNFCPYCQLPLNLLQQNNINLHLEVCSRKSIKHHPVKECPKGLKCCSSMICHYERYAHKLLANARANCHVELQKSTCVVCLGTPNFLEVESKHNSDSSSEDFEIQIHKRKQIKRPTNADCKLNLKPSLQCRKLQKRKSSDLVEKYSKNCNKSCRRSILQPAEISETDSLCNIESSSSEKMFVEANISNDTNDKAFQNIALNERLAQNVKLTVTDGHFSSDTDESDSLLNSVTINTIEPKNSYKTHDINSSKLDIKAESKQKQGDIRSMLFGIKPLKNTVPSYGTKYSTHEEMSLVNEKKRQCPFYKKIFGTDIAVDAFSYGLIPGINFYFLTHFHYDHYMGLSKKFKANVYCSHVTGNLVKARLHLPEDQIKRLPMNTHVKIGKCEVILLEANHCPGAVLLIFKLCNGQVILHTGDFRAIESLQNNIKRYCSFFNTIHLDTTYLNPNYDFPSQADVVEYISSEVYRIVKNNSRSLVVTGTYCIGKEKIFLGIARKIKCMVYVSNDKLKTLKCLDDPEISNMLTCNKKETNLHVVPMKEINARKLHTYLSKFGDMYDQIVAIKPTGWTHKGAKTDLHTLQPSLYGSVIMYEIPYSEHSSFLELKDFVKSLKPKKIIPTVNVANPESRKRMDAYLNDWKK